MLNSLTIKQLSNRVEKAYKSKIGNICGTTISKGLQELIHNQRMN